MVVTWRRRQGTGGSNEGASLGFAFALALLFQYSNSPSGKALPSCGVRRSCSVGHAGPSVSPRFHVPPSRFLFTHTKVLSGIFSSRPSLRCLASDITVERWFELLMNVCRPVRLLKGAVVGVLFDFFVLGELGVFLLKPPVLKALATLT